MAKIGIITFNFTIDNYGQVLQYLATQEYLRELGHKALLVEPNGWRKTPSRYIKRTFQILWRFIKRIVHYKNNPTNKKDSIIESTEIKKQIEFKRWLAITNNQEKKHPRHFNEFKKKYFLIKSGTYDDILDEKFDAFCVGSDQTWSGAGYHWLLGWVPPKVKRFSIAPSIGHRKYTKLEINSFIPYLRKFDFITVREENGIQFSNQCGRNDAIKVLDPVFLLQADSYSPFINISAKKDDPYVFIYMLGGEIELPMAKIFDFCRQQGLKIKYVESQGRNEDFNDKIFATVEEWLGLIKGASFIITNSFHGTAFSIILQKPFLTFPLINLMKDMNERIYDLLEQMGLKERIYKGNLDILMQKIDWSISKKRIIDNKDTLNRLIKEAL